MSKEKRTAQTSTATVVSRRRWWQVKIHAVPFVIGAWLPMIWLDDSEFGISATLIMILLVFTKQVDL